MLLYPRHRPLALLLGSLLGLQVGLARASHGSASANLTWTEAKARAARVSKVRYRISLDLPARSPGYRGEATVSFHLSSPGPLFLDFQGDEVRRLVVNGASVASPRHENDRLHLAAGDLRVGENVVEVRYRNEYDKDGAGLHKVVDSADQSEYLYTQFEPFDANRLFPCFDQPDLRATYAMTIKAPPEWVVVSNGAEVDRRPDGTRRFAETRPFAPYLVAVAAGPFQVYEDGAARIPSRVLVIRSMASHADPERIFEVTRQGFDFFERYFEMPYPFGKYDQVFVPQFNWGAMENVGCVIFSGDRAIYRHEPSEAELERRANTILHEMAHMWFGDIVTMKWWNDIWLNESFATYMAHLAQARATRFQGIWESFLRGTKQWAYWQDQLPTTHPIETEVPDTRTTFQNFDGITYGKGASTLKQLAFYVGDEAFRRGVVAYLAEHAWGNATRADFLASLEASSGLDLAEWTRLWLQRSGVNTITPELRLDRGGRITALELLQQPGNGDATLRPHRLMVGLYDLVGERLVLRREEAVTVQGERTRVVALEGEPAPDFLYANHQDHAFAKVFLDARSLAFARTHLAAMPGSMLRSVVWQTLWFMVRDGVASPEEYLDLFLAEAGDEVDPKVVESLLENVQRALDQYLPEERRAGILSRVSRLAWERLRSSPPGSDLQKAWFDAMVSSCERRVDGLRIEQLLDGRLVIPGLQMDPEKRWRLVRQSCALGHPRAEDLLAAESARDPSELGTRAAFRARASLPDAAGKAEVWRRVLSDDSASLAMLKEGMRGFWWRTQRELLAEYGARFFRDLPAVATSRGPYFAESYVWSLFPGVLVSEATLATAERFLATEGEALGPLRRLVAEATDELRRALRIRRRISEEE